MADKLAADAAGIARAAQLLRDGELVAFPTDTVYGIGCRTGDEAALSRIYEAKRRDPEKAVPWLIGSMAAIGSKFRADDRAARLAERFWPGAVTLVLPASDGSATQAFRVPAHDVALALLAATGPLAVTSARRYGAAPEIPGRGVFLVQPADGLAHKFPFIFIALLECADAMG